MYRCKVNYLRISFDEVKCCTICNSILIKIEMDKAVPNAYADGIEGLGVIPFRIAPRKVS